MKNLDAKLVVRFLIAIIVIGAWFFLKLKGIDGTANLAFGTVIGFYFGHELFVNAKSSK